jgi:peptidoglycan/LPS O-acetylase OafA/YrhL
VGIIRILLALSVVFAHSTSFFGYSFVGSEVAVKAFYIISGFYMSLILNEKYIGKNSSFRLFITNRFMRLYPIYWAILLLTIGLSIVSLIYTGGSDPVKLRYYINYSHSLNPGSYLFLIFTNIFMFFQDIVMFLGLNTSNGNLFFTKNFSNTDPTLYSFLFVPQAWTIGIELTFYLIAPFILRKKLRLILLILFIAITIKFILLHNGLNYDPWTYRFFPAEIMFFMLGNLAYRVYKKIKIKKVKISYVLPMFIVLMIFTMVYYNLHLVKKDYLYFGLFTMFIPFIFLITKEWKIDTFIGELSYPIYICHIFLNHLLRFLGYKEVQGWFLAIFSILFAIILNELIAKRIEKIRQRRLVISN